MNTRFEKSKDLAGTRDFFRSDRSTAQYEYMFGRSAETFRGLDVLEIGPGRTEQFAKRIKLSGARSVTLLDPMYTDADLMLDDGITRVRGFAESADFQPNSFDRIISLYGVPGNIHVSSAVKRSLDNSVRWLRKGGEGLFCGVPEDDEKRHLYVYRPLLEGTAAVVATILPSNTANRHDRILRISKEL